MYIPKHFSQQDSTKIKKLIAQNSFVTLLSFSDDQKVRINHLPVILSRQPGEENVLVGHMSRANPQWLDFQKNPKATIIVHGPNAYISPLWYTTKDVPTWNYAVAHLHGQMELVEGYEEQVEILKTFSSYFEPEWEFEIPEDLNQRDRLTKSIISFRFHPQDIEAKFKLSQNRSPEDQRGVIAGLEQRTDEGSRRVRELMIENG